MIKFRQGRLIAIGLFVLGTETVEMSVGFAKSRFMRAFAFALGRQFRGSRLDPELGFTAGLFKAF